MKNHRFINSKWYKILDYIFRLVILNVMVIVPSFFLTILYSILQLDTASWWYYLTLLPMIAWLFPAVVACAHVILKYELNDTSAIFKEFFKSLKATYFKSLKASLVIYVFAFLLINSITFFGENVNIGTIYWIGFLLSVSFALIFLIMFIHLPLVLMYFNDLKFIEYYKLSFIMAFKDLGITILMAIVVIIAVLIMATVGTVSYFVMFLGGISVPMYLIIKLSFKQYIKIYQKVEENNDNEKK